MVAEAAPKTGVTKVGPFEKTKFPVPVLVVTPDPPWAIGRIPVAPVVRSVIPPPPPPPPTDGAEYQVVPFDVNTLFVFPGATVIKAPAPFPSKTSFTPRLSTPVPPFETERMPDKPEAVVVPGTPIGPVGPVMPVNPRRP